MKTDKGNIYNHVGMVEVSLKHGSEQLEGSASAVLIDQRHGFVLTHAALFNPLAAQFQQKQLKQLEKNGILVGNGFYGLPEIRVTLPKAQDGAEASNGLHDDDTIKDVISEVVASAEKNVVPTFSNCMEDSVHFNTYKASLKMIFECRSLRNTFDNVMPNDSWKFYEEFAPDTLDESGKKIKQKTNTDKIQRLLLPCFVLLKLHNLQNSKYHLYDRSRRSTIESLPIQNSLDIRQGDRVEIVATPFGQISPETFLNSRSGGIISGVAGPRHVLLMTDARCVPGCEGGAVVSCYNGERMLAGMIVASLCWNNNVTLGLTLACAISEILDGLSNLPLITDSPLNYIILSGKSAEAGFVEKAQGLVPCVSVGSSWGSAVYVGGNQPCYITCSHVLRGASFNGVKIRWPSVRQQGPCSIQYKTPAQAHFDIAVLEEPSTVSGNTYRNSLVAGRVEEGETVYVVGHAIFKPDLNLPPMVTLGTVSKVIKYRNVPIMIQTTCAVHSGASGGGVFNTRGQLVGLVVCNSKDAETGALYPHINMAVPMATIAPVINKYLHTKDPHVLEQLHVKIPQVLRIWNLDGRVPSCSLHSNL